MGDRMPLPVGPEGRGPEERGRGWSRRRSAGAIVVAVVILAVGFAVPVARRLLDDKPVTRSGADTWERLPRPLAYPSGPAARPGD